MVFERSLVRAPDQGNRRSAVAGSRKFDEIMEKLEIMIEEMMSDGGPAPQDLGSVGTHDARKHRVTRTRATTCRTTMCVRSRGMITNLAKDLARKDKTEQERGIEEKELRASCKRDDGGTKGDKKGSKGSNPDRYGDNDTRSNGHKGKGEGKCNSEIQDCYDCGDQGHIGVNCPYKWANSKDEDGQGSSWEGGFEGESPE